MAQLDGTRSSGAEEAAAAAPDEGAEDEDEAVARDREARRIMAIRLQGWILESLAQTFLDMDQRGDLDHNDWNIIIADFWGDDRDGGKFADRFRTACCNVDEPEKPLSTEFRGKMGVEENGPALIRLAITEMEFDSLKAFTQQFSDEIRDRTAAAATAKHGAVPEPRTGRSTAKFDAIAKPEDTP